MKLKANHITAVRVLLLPLPYLLIYGGVLARMTALAGFTLLALTDYWDGLLARRQGSTSLGKLLDPIADKIFIAVTLVPLADLKILPVWLVWIIFLREFLVSELRSVLSGVGKRLQVTELAKLKTTVQMSGAGFIFLMDTFPGGPATAVLLAACLLAAVMIGARGFLKTGKFSSRVRSAAVLFGLGLVLSLILETQQTVFFFGLVIAGITLASGTQYFIAGFPECFKQGLSTLVRVFSSLVIPLLSLALMPVAHFAISGIVVFILSLEFASQGIDMWAVQEGRAGLSIFKRRLLIPVVVVTLACGLAFSGPEKAAQAFLWVTAAGCLCYTAADAWTYRKLFF